MANLTLLQQIEELRISMFKIKEGRSYTDPEVIAASQELDAVLDKYQEMLLKKKGPLGLETKGYMALTEVDSLTLVPV